MSKILNLGSGDMGKQEGIINVDIRPLPTVDVVVWCVLWPRNADAPRHCVTSIVPCRAHVAFASSPKFGYTRWSYSEHRFRADKINSCFLFVRFNFKEYDILRVCINYDCFF